MPRALDVTSFACETERGTERADEVAGYGSERIGAPCPVCAPVLFDVTLDGQPFQELHVDGGIFAQLFLYPASVSRFRRERLAQGLPTAPARAWVIRNGRLDPEWAAVERQTLGIVNRAIIGMIAASGYNDVLRIYAAAERDGVDYNLAFIGPDFTMVRDRPFDPSYMRPLYEHGRQRALRGDAWVKQPPI